MVSAPPPVRTRPVTDRPARLAAAAVSAIAVFIGCGPAAAPPQALPQPPVRRPVSARAPASNAAQRAPGYAEATARFAAHDYRGALAALDRVVPDPDWSADDRAYLDRQRAICRAAMAVRPAPVAPSPPPRRTPEQADCGPRALAVVCAKLGVVAQAAELRTLAGTTGAGTTMAGLARAARAKGLVATGLQLNRAALEQLQCPAVAWVGGDHYIAVLSVHDGAAEVRDPNAAGPARMTIEDLLRGSAGILLRIDKPKGVPATSPIPGPKGR